MSAWLCSAEHVSRLANTWFPACPDLMHKHGIRDAKMLFAVWHNANRRSIKAIAPNRPRPKHEYLPEARILGDSPCPGQGDDNSSDARYALLSLCYQSCEFAGWDTCKARKLIDGCWDAPQINQLSSEGDAWSL